MSIPPHTNEILDSFWQRAYLRIFWAQPNKSTLCDVDIPPRGDMQPHGYYCVAGWQCSRCKTIIFCDAKNLHDLDHLCADEVEKFRIAIAGPTELDGFASLYGIQRKYGEPDEELRYRIEQARA